MSAFSPAAISNPPSIDVAAVVDAAPVKKAILRYQYQGYLGVFSSGIKLSTGKDYSLNKIRVNLVTAANTAWWIYLYANGAVIWSKQIAAGVLEYIEIVAPVLVIPSGQNLTVSFNVTDLLIARDLTLRLYEA